ncbi:hypothetical protein EBB07_02595 [Paenibacillaceae bacterium]|nr:hypothetical protein EBB07_02595 [Paenibacillaceae bacterium]
MRMNTGKKIAVVAILLAVIAGPFMQQPVARAQAEVVASGAGAVKLQAGGSSVVVANEQSQTGTENVELEAPEVGQPAPGDGEPRTPGDGEPGTPGDGEPGTPGDGEPGTPGDRQPGTPGSGQPGTVDDTQPTQQDVRAFLYSNDTISIGNSVSTTYGLSGVAGNSQRVFAQVLTIGYDTDQLEFTGVEPLKDGLRIVSQSVSTRSAADNERQGIVRIVVASEGAEHAIVDDGSLLALHWRGKVSSGTASSAAVLLESVISDSEGDELIVSGAASRMAKNGALKKLRGDVNGDGKVTIGDLGIVSAALGKTSADPDWANYARADVNRDGKVDEADLNLVARLILGEAEHLPEALLTGTNKVRASDVFDLIYGISELPANIIAQDMTLVYDAEKLEFIAFESVDDEVFSIIASEEKPGEIRFLGIHHQELQHPSGDLMKLRFKVKADAPAGSATIAVTVLIAADGEGNELEIDGASHDIQIEAKLAGDLNGDGKISIGDLALLMKYYGKTSADADWESLKQYDFNSDNVIDIKDLAILAALITSPPGGVEP